MTSDACSIEGCEKQRSARGWCKFHYQRWYLYGDPLREPPSAEERFWTFVSKGEGCWEWTGHIIPTTGYGQWSYGGRPSKKSLAHRYSYQIMRGEIPARLQLDHLCRNRRCVNPDHLEAVTQRVNILRGNGASARNARKTHCIRGHAFDAANTYLTPGTGHRQCRACRTLREMKAA